MAENISLSIGDQLPAECLLEIFSYLSLDDMMQVKNVCRKWHQISEHWFKQVQTLIFIYPNCMTWRLHEKFYKRKILTGSDYEKLISILHLYGHHIKYLKVKLRRTSNNLIEKRNQLIFQLISNLCKNIIEVNISEDESSSSPAYKIMATHWKKLKKLQIKFLTRTVDDNVLELLRNNKQLKTLSLIFDDNPKCLVIDEFFTYLPATIEEIKIIFNSTHDKELKNFIFASKNLKSLRSLKFFNLQYLSDAAVMAIADIKSLVHLSLIQVDRYESRGTLDPIASLKGLKSLDLSYNSDLREDSLINIVESCTKLEQLDIFNQNMLTDRGMAAIAKLEELIILGIDAKNVTIKSIINLIGRLEVFQCHYSQMFDRDAIKLLKRATNLRLVDFSGCYNLTEDMIQEAKKIASERKKKFFCVTGDVSCCIDYEKIITPYFDCCHDLLFVPRHLFPNCIKNYIEELISTEVSLIE